ncbi:hypothetical protein ZWY2020_036952 [Hordeum vulgare]|nr:hypothetical protein ZWY2020_036952 [Hordeum vulgare]
MDLSRSADLVLAVAVFLLCASAEDQLAVGDKLLAGQSLVSAGGAFALGFFSPDDAAGTATRWYLGIWYNGIPGPRTVIWVANRDAPAAGAPTLALANDSRLVMSDADGRVLWNTTVASSSSSQTPTAAVLTNEGNLVVQEANDAELWQSFDHPIDTLVPGMKMRLSYRTGKGDRIVAWKSPGNPAPGLFSYGLDPSTSLQLIMWNGTRPYWRTPIWQGYSVASMYVSDGTVIYTAIVDTDEEIYMTFTFNDGAAPTRYVVTSSGRFQLLSWNGTLSAWATLQSWPSSGCGAYSRCGAYGYCDVTSAPAACRCLDGFEPASAADWSAGRLEQGCRRKQALPPCGGVGGVGFVAIRSMKVPDKFSIDSSNRTAGECAATCSCVAYAYANVQINSAKDELIRCVVWSEELVDAQMIDARWGGETLYLRVAEIDDASTVPVLALPNTGRKSSRNAVKIALPVLASLLLLTCTFFVSFWRFRVKGRKTESQNKNKSGKIGGDHTEDLEFPSIRFADIVVATDNFSKTLMIGRGGFGKVYKSAFLSAAPRGPKLLIYEYLPNRGLNAILFDSVKKAVLDWPTRLGIIKGVARGLPYLHQDSRLTVIHRDLKASNVLLDAEMRPKIADFGMAKIFGDNQVKASTRNVVGTYGYIAPEYSTGGVFSVKSDVYSFGVLLLEIVSGTRISAIDGIMECPSLTVYAWSLWREGRIGKLVDPSMAESCSEDEAMLCIHVGLLCVEDDPSRRPLMSSVVSILENGSAPVVASASLPAPNQPGYFKMIGEKSQRSDLENTRNAMTMTALHGR